jgi:glucose/arabinose dehydrogenase
VSRGIRRLSFRGQALSAVTAVTLAILWPHAAPPVVDAATPQTGFVETTVMTGLIHPTVLRFAQDGRVFVAEKSGLIKVFDNLADPTPTVFADLRTNVHDFWDRGLLGMALHPDFPDTPFVYAAYTFDHELGSTNAPPRWGDTCPTPPGATTDGCVVSGRLSRLRAAGDAMTGAEQVLIEDWCQQYPSHSVGSVEFGPDGALYMSAGEAASFTFADHGQDGNPLNPCGDPPGGVGAVLAPPTAEGGALRAQDLRTSGDPVTLDGTIIRVDAATGAGLPTNPLASSADPNARRIIAHGLRNPFRFAFRPGSREIWIGDVGWNDWEEINRIVDPVDAQLENFGWPCYEHLQRQAAFDSANLTVCENLYAQPNADTKAYFAYHRDNNVVPGDGCPTGSGSISGLSFEFAPLGGSFPIEYRGALFFSDYSRDCLWVMPKDGGVLPAPGRVRPFVVGAANPVDLEFGPGGDLYYVDFDGGSIRRVAYAGVAPGSASFASPTSYPTATNAHGVGTGDVNGDGKLDLAVANAGSGNVSVLLGNGNGTFQASANFATGVSPKSVTVADVSGDGRLDLVTADQGSSTVSVLRGNGAGSFAAATSFPACNQAHEVALGNFNGDGMPDIAVACWGGSVISVLLATGGGSFGPPINSTSGAAPHSLVARDFDRDGKQDLAVANRDGNNVGVLRGNGNGTFAAPAVYPTGAGPHSIRIGDLNRDGNSDLVTANEAADNVSVLLGAAGGTFAPASNYATGQVPKGIAVGDLNGDGLPDVVTSNTAGNYPSGNSNPGGDQVSVLLGNGAGALGSPANFLAGHTPFSVVVAQLDSDGQPDLATANWFGNSVSVIRNTTAGAAPPPTGSTYLSDLAWTSMTNGWGPVELDRSNGEQATGDGRTITLNGTTYTKGLGAHALSDVRYALSGSCSRFTAQVGVDDEVGANGSVTFEVYTGTTRVYDSGPMTGVTAARAVDVSIAGATALRLVVTDGGDGNGFDHADWAVAQIECSSGQDTTPPNVTATTPAAGATGVAVTVSPTATFSEAMDPASLTSTTFSLVAQGQSTPIPAAVSYANRVATLDPNGDLAAATSYTATVKGGVGGARDLAGNVLSADVSWTFTTAGAAPPPTGSTYLSDLAWTSMTNGWGPVELDRSNGEQATGDGRTITLNGTTYTKGLGAHALSDVRYALSGSCSRFTAQVGVDDEVGANGSVTFEVYTGTTRVYDSGPMTGVTAARAVDVSIAGATALRLVVTDGGDGNGFDHADWAVAQIECSSGQDTTPPNVTATTPAAGATGVAVTVSPTATFSEAMDPASLTSTTFSLVAQGQSTPIPAAVSYANRVATLDPNGDLAAATSYTATVKGGVGGARDLAGNVLSADVSWTFTTAGAAPPANRPPSATIDGPAATLKWKVADVVSFAGHATDPEDGTIPASRLSWSLVLQHCPSSCHSHPVETWSGISAGSFSTPDHEYPSYLELTLTAADSAGLTGTVTRRLDPRTVDLTFGASPGGLQLVVNATSSNAPFMRTVIVGSTNSVSATSPQVQGGSTYEFSAWSDGGAQTHNVIAPESPSTFTASYVVAPPRNTGLPAISGPARVGRTVTVSDGTWSGSQPMTFGYQWLRCSSTDALSCTPIPDSATKNYTITSNDVDFRLRATVTATNAGGTATATSNASQRVKG